MQAVVCVRRELFLVSHFLNQASKGRAGDIINLCIWQFNCYRP
jgi:hypothetical protein